MRKFFQFALMAFALVATPTVLVSCGDDDDDDTPAAQQETSIGEAQWKSGIVGSWTYDSGKRSGTTTETHNGVKKTGKMESQNRQNFTISSDQGTFTKKYDQSTAWDDGTTSDGSFSYTIKFKYEYVAEAYEFTSKAYLKGTVTESDNEKYFKVGDKFNVSIFSMTKNSVSLCSGKDSHVDRITMTRK